MDNLEAKSHEAIIIEYDLNPDAQIMENGFVALQYRRQQRITVRCGSTGITRDYVFAMQANISLGFVHPRDVPCVLAKKGGCCGKKKRGIFVYANEATVRQWTNRGGR